MGGGWKGFNGENGWAFGDVAGEADRSAMDVESIYRLLEEKIIPLYYDINDEGYPKGWVRIMKETIRSNAARFSARRMVKEYVEQFYLKAIRSGQTI